jgi:hypothetical protein
MWSKSENLHFCVKIDLRKGLALIRGMRAALTDEEQNRVSQAIVEHLQIKQLEDRGGACPRGASSEHYAEELAETINAIERR